VAESWVERGLGRGRAEATVLSLKASLLLDEYRHLEAESLLERVERYHRQARQPVKEAKALLKLAMVSHARERPREAVQRVERALDVLDLEEDPLLHTVARHNLVAFLLECNELPQARAVFDDLPETEDRLLRLRRSWLEGNLLRAEGDLDGAAERYDATRVGYLAPDLGGPLHYNVALVSLDLAMVAAEQKRHDAVRELARDAVVLLTRAGAPQEAFAAMRLLVDTLETKAVTVAFIRRIARRVARLRPAH
jgi:tetratricopeptide (TPR) repeat protein